MSPQVSYFEFSLRDGELVGHLGSAPAEIVLARSHTDPSIRICIQEPSAELIAFRVQCGFAELTESGPAPIPLEDPTERRGAWIRLRLIGGLVWSALHEAWVSPTQAPALLRGLETGWAEFNGQNLKDASATSAYHALLESKLALPEDRIFIRFGGSPEDLRQALSLLAESTP